MNVYIVSLFPDRIIDYFKVGVLKRALEEDLVRLIPVPVRDFGVTRHCKVDDTPYGGGAGMLLRVDVLTAAVESIPEYRDARLVYFSPKGACLAEGVNQMANDLEKTLIVICGAFEGVDERFFSLFNVELVSLGDVVVSSGDAVAIPFLDASFCFVDIMNFSRQLVCSFLFYKFHHLLILLFHL